MNIMIRNGLIGVVVGCVVTFVAAIALQASASASPAGAAIAHGSKATADNSVVEKVHRRYYRRYGYRNYGYRPYRYYGRYGYGRDCTPYNGPYGYYDNPYCSGGFKFN